MMVRTKNPKDRPPHHNMSVADKEGPDPPGIRKRRLENSSSASAVSSAAARGRGSSAAARGRGNSARNVLKKDKIPRYSSSSYEPHYDSDSDSDSELRSATSKARSSSVTSRGKVFEGNARSCNCLYVMLCRSCNGISKRGNQ